MIELGFRFLFRLDFKVNDNISFFIIIEKLKGSYYGK